MYIQIYMVIFDRILNIHPFGMKTRKFDSMGPNQPLTLNKHGPIYIQNYKLCPLSNIKFSHSISLIYCYIRYYRYTEFSNIAIN